MEPSSTFPYIPEMAGELQTFVEKNATIFHSLGVKGLDNKDFIKVNKKTENSFFYVQFEQLKLL